MSVGLILCAGLSDPPPPQPRAGRTSCSHCMRTKQDACPTSSIKLPFRLSDSPPPRHLLLALDAGHRHGVTVTVTVTCTP